MKSKEIREMDTEGLNKKLQDLKQELFNLRLRKNVEQLENPKMFRSTRRGIAQILTVLREKGSN
ncbi:MAG: 50S ribosomal protein L29 [Campylobacterota bacterium]|nr:50S ribosomal protein L29 [Campylobacterota bacterium]